MTTNNFNLDIIYVDPNNQIIITRQIQGDTTLMQAVKESGILDKIDTKYTGKLKFGIYGNLTLNPNEYILKNGDRIEIYRPLIADPKKNRLQRLAKLKQKKDI